MSVFPLFYITYIDVFGEIGARSFFVPQLRQRKAKDTKYGE